MLPLARSVLVLSSLLLAAAWTRAQETPPAPATPEHTAEAAEPENESPPRRRGRGRRARGVDEQAAEATEDAGEQGGEATGPQDEDKPKAKEKPGIPVDDMLVQSFCGRCHQRDSRDHMTRISYVRKSPEGWSRTIKRMGRLHGLQLTADTAKALVRSLSNSHGLARKEAERGLYDSERRVHWSEEHHDDDFKRACAQCHPLGRALLQHRDKEEWELLRATHVAMFPGSRRQVGGGPPSENSSRFRGAAAASGDDGGGGGASGGGGEGGDPRRARGNVGDRVLQQLAKDQPLFTPEWEAWTKNHREVPLAGRWTVTGHEVGRGDVIGQVVLTRADVDEYELQWTLRYSDGSNVTRTGRGVLYAGYSWRSSSDESDGARWRDVLLLDDAWQTLRGRSFRGSYDEIGIDLTLHRDLDAPRVIAVGAAALEVPTTGHRLDVYGERFAADAQPADFFVGEGLTVTAVERVDERHVVLLVDVAADAALGTRTVAYGPRPGTATVTLYDTVDYVRIRPLQGLARIGGAQHPKQIERFEAYAVHRGKDGKPYTDDDVDLFQVRPEWALAELHVRDDDDDVRYVGSIDPATGVFTPNVDGPNDARKWQANNIGDVFVTCEVALDVPMRPKPAQADAKPAGDGADADQAIGGGAAGARAPGGDDAQGGSQGDAQDGAQDGAAAAGPPRRETKTFRARTHLIVTVPVYARWQVLEWEDR